MLMPRRRAMSARLVTPLMRTRGTSSPSRQWARNRRDTIAVCRPSIPAQWIRRCASIVLGRWVTLAMSISAPAARAAAAILPSAPAPTSVPAPPATVSSADIDKRLERSAVTQGKFVNISLAWTDRADLDLLVIEPSGVKISTYDDGVRQSPSGGSLDIDANMCEAMSGCPYLDEPIENISWNQKPPSGRYEVRVALFSANELMQNRRPIPFTVVVTLDGKKSSHEGVINVNDMVCSAERCRSKVQFNITSFTIQ